MHSICVSLIVLATLVYTGECVLTVRISIGGIGTEIVQLKDLNGDSWTFENYPSDWSQVVGKSCLVEFSDEYIDEQIQTKNGTAIQGKIDNVGGGDLRIAMTLGSSITITLPKTSTKELDGYKLKNGNIALVIETAREEELLEAFKGCITAYVELGEGLIKSFNKKQGLIQPIPNLQLKFKNNSLLFFKHLEINERIQEPTMISYISVEGKISTTQCSINFSSTSGFNAAVGIANVYDVTGIMWIQNAWDETSTKSVLNINDHFEKLKSITSCQLAATKQAQDLDAPPVVNNDNGLTLRLKTFYFDIFTQKIIADFDIGELTKIFFMDGTYKGVIVGYINEKAKILTVPWDQKEYNKFETCRTEKLSPERFMVLPELQMGDSSFTIFTIDLCGFAIKSKITEKLGRDNIFQAPLCQYSY